MNGDLPFTKGTDFDRLAQNDGHTTTVREIIGLLSVVAWNKVADAFDGAYRSQIPLPNEDRCRELGETILLGAGLVIFTGFTVATGIDLNNRGL